ncbi:MAG: hypothetical protein B6D46_10155 [Polyangiaceae bacterium UTPRO1]|nr:MAG: hypothetical protein B6D46_10155 [Polyangiaceae bacterium UTPRO1]
MRRIFARRVQEDRHAVERHAARRLLLDATGDLHALARLAGPRRQRHGLVERRRRRRRRYEEMALQARERAGRIAGTLDDHRRGREGLREQIARAVVAERNGGDQRRRAARERRNQRRFARARNRHVEEQRRHADERRRRARVDGGRGGGKNRGAIPKTGGVELRRHRSREERQIRAHERQRLQHRRRDAVRAQLRQRPRHRQREARAIGDRTEVAEPIRRAQAMRRARRDRG